MKISIIMPAFNSERFIHSAMASVLEQSYSNLELIVVDDGSTDRTGEIVRSFADPRVKYVFQANKGVRKLAETINAGLSLASGDLVTMFPSDDLCEPKRFALQVKVFEDPEVVLAFGRAKLINEKDEEIGAVIVPRNLLSLLAGPVQRLYQAYVLENFVPQPTIMFRRSTLCGIGGYIQHRFLYAEDYPTQMKFIGLGKWVFIDAVLARYRLHSGQMTRTHLMPMFRGDARYRLQLIKEMSDEQVAAYRQGRKAMRRTVIQKMYHGYYRMGRSYAQLGQSKLAFKFFSKAIAKSSPSTALKSCLGIAALALHINLETMFNAMRICRR